MPRPVDPAVVKLYAEAFKMEPKLASNGFSFLCDISSKLFKSKRVNLRDMNGNIEALVRQKCFLPFEHCLKMFSHKFWGEGNPVNCMSHISKAFRA